MTGYQILTGSCLDILPTLPAESVHCCVTSPPYLGLRSYLPEGHDDKAHEMGAEPTVDEYVANMVAVFREVWRVLHPSGTVWLNLGSSYSDKQLLGEPWRVAFALQDDGWYLRQEIIWAKAAAMPESVRDRCTKSHEQVFMLTKAARYFYDAEAIREPQSEGSHGGTLQKFVNGNDRKLKHLQSTQSSTLGGVASDYNPAGRNKRTVWTLGPEPTPFAHFATMPTKLVTPCILAGSSAKGVCAACGNPYERVVEREFVGQSNPFGPAQRIQGNRTALSGKQMAERNASRGVIDKGWIPTCTCNADIVPATVLDCFAGAGTTLLVANRLGRNSIGIELNPEYVRLATERLERSQPMLTGLAI